MFSKACEYAIRATIYIAQQSRSNECVSLKNIAEHINSPEAFTAKILQKLSFEKILSAKKGSNGGYFIDDSLLKNLKLNTIVNAIDGNTIYTRCGLGLSQCSEKKPCPLHHHFKEIRNDLQKMLEQTNVLELANDISKGNGVLKF
jgi:Rrf2 family transcriptional regulator, iron-sulfur cluster assembly transcription factor